MKMQKCAFRSCFSSLSRKLEGHFELGFVVLGSKPRTPDLIWTGLRGFGARTSNPSRGTSNRAETPKPSPRTWNPSPRTSKPSPKTSKPSPRTSKPSREPPSPASESTYFPFLLRNVGRRRRPKAARSAAQRRRRREAPPRPTARKSLSAEGAIVGPGPLAMNSKTMKHKPTETQMPSCTARENKGRRQQPAGFKNHLNPETR